MAVKVWSGVSVTMQSAAAAALTVSGVTKASPGVVTYTGTDPLDGDFVLMTAQGMSQIDGRVFRVDNVNTGSDTFELEGENTTNFDTFVSGTAQVITLGTTLTSARNVSSSGGDFDFIDVSTIHDIVSKQVPGNASPATFTFDCYWDPADAALLALKAASDLKAQRVFKITFADGAFVVFSGYVGATLLPGGSAQDAVTTSVSITMFGRPTAYAS